MAKHFALVGNPNVGKTTLFNALTGLAHVTGNYPGVTVERKTGTYRFEARLLGGTEPILSVDGVQVRPGKNEDPRLQSIVLEGVRAWRIDLVDDTGALRRERTSGRVFVRSPDGWRGQWFMSSRVEMLTRGPVDGLDKNAPIRLGWNKENAVILAAEGAGA